MYRRHRLALAFVPPNTDSIADGLNPAWIIAFILSFFAHAANPFRAS
jgi:hypothetical protein